MTDGSRTCVRSIENYCIIASSGGWMPADSADRSDSSQFLRSTPLCGHDHYIHGRGTADMAPEIYGGDGGLPHHKICGGGGKVSFSG